MSAFLNAELARQVQERLQALRRPVRLLFFTQKAEQIIVAAGAGARAALAADRYLAELEQRAALPVPPEVIAS
jgi:hypothetical protein